MTPREPILIAASDPALRGSLIFVLESAGFGTSGHPSASEAFSCAEADRSVCAVVDDQAIDSWPLAPDQFRRFARPVILLTGRFDAVPALPATLVIKPFLGEPLLEAVRSAIAGADARRPT